MTSLISSTGSKGTVSDRPFVLAIASHKGGTGRTTAAAALAWSWAQLGMQVTLVDADPVRALSLLVADRSGACPWPGARLQSRLVGEENLSGDLVVIDCPSLTEPAAQEVLALADGVVLTCLADPLSLRSIPSATAAIQSATATNPRLELLGILLPIVDEADSLQSQMLAALRELHGGLLLEPVVPMDTAYRQWPMRPGAPPPDGAALTAYTSLAQAFRGLLTRG